MTGKTRLVFVARWARRDMGSSRMRINQLAAHMRRFHAEDYDTRVAYVSREQKLWVKAWVAAQPKGSIYVFSKYAALGWEPEDFERLRRKSRAIFVDYVDLDVKYMVPHGVDGHIATSHIGAHMLRKHQEALKAAGQTVSGDIHVVLHNYDAALDQITLTPPDHLSVVFFGSPAAAATSPEILRQITVLEAGLKPSFDRNVGKLGAFNCHYCVRPAMPDEDDRSFRPFTKGITAAACNSVILTNRQTDDAVELLGEDYPYMLADTSEKTLNDGFGFLKESFDGRPWHDAMERVMALKQKTSHKGIAAQLHTAIQSVN
ncbi:MAG: hypothetical protein JJ938_09610 [Roseicyclus sp.]|nr:hypothetical protein [Roseicyclus sp.]MBO6625124.1 hypothetical protein [Roseicyclus sp.]MBO6923095.1 hypothetical protein [Roseicyclus sp.]